MNDKDCFIRSTESVRAMIEEIQTHQDYPSVKYTLKMVVKSAHKAMKQEQADGTASTDTPEAKLHL